jgi:riboflavin biosynthesis pyrimidine reductase
MSTTTLTDPELNRDRLVERYGIRDRTVPRTRVNFISSLDGAATHDGLSGGLNNAADKVVFDTLRMLSDVVVVGAGTIRAEGYGDIRLEPDAVAWRRSEGLVEQPAIAIVSSKLDISPAHPLFKTTGPRPMVITHAASPVDRRTALAEVADVLVCGESDVDMRLMIDTLATAGFPQIVCEGGPHLFGALIEADCVDELCLTISPVLEGGSAGRIARGGAQATRRMALMHTFAVEDMLFLRYERRI